MSASAVNAVRSVFENAVARRLGELRLEHEKGHRQLDALDLERQELGSTLLRIGGAIQVLEELLEAGESQHGP